MPTARQVCQISNESKLTLKASRSERSLWCSPGWTQVPWLHCSTPGGPKTNLGIHYEPVKMGWIQDGSKIQNIYVKDCKGWWMLITWSSFCDMVECATVNTSGMHEASARDCSKKHWRDWQCFLNPFLACSAGLQSSYFTSNSLADLMGQEKVPSGRIEQCNEKNRSLKNADL